MKHLLVGGVLGDGTPDLLRGAGSITLAQPGMPLPVLLRAVSLCVMLYRVLPEASPPDATCTEPPKGDDTVCGAPGEELLGSAPARGMHVLRALPCRALPHTGQPSCPLFDLEVFVDGMRELRAPHTLTVNCSQPLGELVSSLQALTAPTRSNRSDIPPQGSVARFELESRAGFDRWAFYTPHGERLLSAAGILRCGRALAIEGGLFVWPGVRLGFRRPVHLLGDGTFRQVTLITQSLQPLVFLVDPLLSEPECEHIIGVTEPILLASHVSHFDHDLGKASTQVRDPLSNHLRMHCMDYVESGFVWCVVCGSGGARCRRGWRRTPTVPCAPSASAPAPCSSCRGSTASPSRSCATTPRTDQLRAASTMRILITLIRSSTKGSHGWCGWWTRTALGIGMPPCCGTICRRNRQSPD
eukprot:COSAG05_NODE_191_length_14617_cov_90.240736_4_plen_414_part_00